MLEYHKTTEEEKYVISEWKYEGDYSIYNNISYEEQLKSGCGFANPKNDYYSFYDGTDLVGYINLVDKGFEVFLGVGVNPAFCDQGYGQKICHIARNLSHKFHEGKKLYLEVRTWNKRAVECYKKAGFHIVGDEIKRTNPIGEGLFYHMTEG